MANKRYIIYGMRLEGLLHNGGLMLFSYFLRLFFVLFLTVTFSSYGMQPWQIQGNFMNLQKSLRGKDKLAQKAALKKFFCTKEVKEHYCTNNNDKIFVIMYLQSIGLGPEAEEIFSSVEDRAIPTIVSSSFEDTNQSTNSGNNATNTNNNNNGPDWNWHYTGNGLNNNNNNGNNNNNNNGSGWNG